MKKMIRYLLLSMIIMAGTLIPAYDAHADNNDSYNYTYVSEGEAGYHEGQSYTMLFNLSDSNNTLHQAYCVDRSTYIVKGSHYSRVNVDDANYYSAENAAHIRAVINNAYPFITLDELISKTGLTSLTSEEAITAAQFAIWHYSNDDSESVKNSNVNNLKNWYLNLPAASDKTIPIGTVSVDSSISRQGETYTCIYSFKTDAKNIDGSPVSLKAGFDKNLEKEYPGISVSNITKTNGIYKLTVTGIPADASFSFTASGLQSVEFDGYFYEPQGGRSASQSLVGAYSGRTEISRTTMFKAPDDEHNTLKIIKIDSVTGDYLEGAEFEIANTKDFDDIVYKVKTGADGIALQSGLTTGRWYVRETISPAGYICYEKPFSVSVGNGITIAECKNTAYGAIEILKTDDNNNPLENAVFNIYTGDKAEGKPLFSNIKSDAEGMILQDNIAPGVYTIVEAKAPDGYRADTRPVTITVKPGEKYTVNIINHKIQTGYIHLFKKDAITEELLSGAVLGIFTDEACTSEICRVTTKSDGYVSTDELIPGSYYVKEIKAPDGYLNDSSPQNITLNENDVCEVTFYDNQIPKTAGNYALTLITGLGLMCTCAILAFVFRKKLIKRNYEKM